jgi:hypothetical protein
LDSIPPCFPWITSRLTPGCPDGSHLSLKYI